jgi:hypothetical protein
MIKCVQKNSTGFLCPEKRTRIHPLNIAYLSFGVNGKALLDGKSVTDHRVSLKNTGAWHRNWINFVAHQLTTTQFVAHKKRFLSHKKNQCEIARPSARSINSENAYTAGRRPFAARTVFTGEVIFCPFEERSETEDPFPHEQKIF